MLQAVVGCIIEATAHELSGDVGIEMFLTLSVIRLARILQVFARVAKLPRTTQSMRGAQFFSATYKIVLALQSTSPMLVNVLLVLAIWIYMYVGRRHDACFHIVA